MIAIAMETYMQMYMEHALVKIVNVKMARIRQKIQHTKIMVVL